MYIGVIRRALKIWLALDPNAYDVEVYHHKDVSDKKRYEKVPMLVRVGSGRAVTRAKELIERLLSNNEIELKKRYADKPLQLLAYTLNRNALVKDKRPELLRQTIHVHDADVLTGADAERFIEFREKAQVEEANFATVSLDVLENNFLDGQKVNIDRLKKKGLIPEDSNGIRIIAGTRLTKPLYVVADEFSLDAVKMIVLTGGRVIRLAPEPSDKQ
jgi:ribosomal protein L18E